MVRPRPGCDMAPGTHKRRESIEVAILSDQGDSALLAGRGEQRVVQERWVVSDSAPSFSRRDGREKPAAVDERAAGWCEDALPSHERPEHRSLELACLDRR